MSDKFKTFASPVVLVACLALIGFLVHEKVDGAYTLAVSAVTAIIAYFTQAPKQGSPPAASVLAGALTAIGAAGIMMGCASLKSFVDSPAFKTALDDQAVACVFTSELVDSSALATACKLDQALVPVLDQLIAQRDAAKKAGVAWNAHADAGARPQ